MNTVTVLEPKVGIDAKTQEKVVKLLTKQLKRIQKNTCYRDLLQQIHSYEDKAVFTDSIICLQLPAYFTDKHIALNTLTKKEIENGQQILDIRINQQTGKFDYCKTYSEDSKEKHLPDYGVLIQADNLINLLSVMKELGDEKVTFYLNKENSFRPIAIHSENVKGTVSPICY